MSFKAYHVLVPKEAVADPEALRAEAALLAKDCGLSPRQRWWSWRGDEWVFGFTDHLTVFFFMNYCSQSRRAARRGIGQHGNSARTSRSCARDECATADCAGIAQT